MYDNNNIITSDQPSFSQTAYILFDSFRLYANSLIAILGVSLMFILIAADFARNQGDEFLSTYFLFFFFIILLYAIWYFIKSRTFVKTIKEWNKLYFDQNYTIIFNTTLPKGNNDTENIIKLSKSIFPELRYDFLKYSPNFFDNLEFFIKSKFFKPKGIEEKRILKAMNYKVNGYLFDFALKTDNGYFIIKNFQDKIVNIDDIIQLTHKAKSKFKNKYQQTNILRIIVVAKNYDKSFLERESLENIMTKEIKLQLKLDLIVKENIGYSILWISPF